MMSAALVHMLIQDLNWSFKLNSYEKYLEEYPEYKKLINILGKHYFETKDDEITFLLDESKLNELLTNDESTKYIKDSCLFFLKEKNGEFNTEKIKNLFNPIVKLFNAWEKADSPGYPPQLPLIIFLIIVASEMGDRFNYNNYYSPLIEALDLDESQRGLVVRSYTDTFSSNSINKLFEEINIWVGTEKNLNTNFQEGSVTNSKHIGWVVNQAIFNQKDLYILTSFFHKMHLNPNDIPNIEIFKNRLINDFYRFSSERRWQSKFSHNLKNRLKEAVNGNEVIRDVIASVLHKELISWDCLELSPDGNRTITSRLAFSEPDPKRGIEFICNLIETDLIAEHEDQNAHAILSDESEETLEIIFKRDIYEDFWFVQLDNFNNSEYTYKLSNYKINILSEDKQIRVFDSKSSNEDGNSKKGSFENMWVELMSNDKPNSISKYSIVCENSKKKLVTDYLNKNAVTFPQFINIENHTVFLNFQFIENREEEKNELKVLNSFRSDSYRLSFYGGLEINQGNYLINHLPSLIIPKEYQELDYSVFANDFELDYIRDIGKTSEYDLNLLKIGDNKNFGEILIKTYKNDLVVDSKIIRYEDYPKTEYVFDSLENELLAYDIELGKNNEMNFLNIYPKKIKTEDLKDGYISGGYIKVTNENRIPKSKFELETINTKWNFIEIIGQQEGSKLRIITTTGNGGNRFNYIGKLESLNKLFTTKELEPVFQHDLANNLNRFTLTEIPFEYPAVFIIYEFNGKKNIKQIGELPPKAITDESDFLKEKAIEWRKLIINTNENFKTNGNNFVKNELWKQYVSFAGKL